MYRYSNGQISLSDFHQPMGMQLREDNRWVKKAQMIPWNKIEENRIWTNTNGVKGHMQADAQSSV